MAEIIKFNGNMKAVVQESELNWAEFKDSLIEDETKKNDKDEVCEYQLRK